jgi:transcriptional regulator with XRE-family HTH domain
MTGQEIRAIRERLNESQAEFAARFGVARNTVSMWESKGPPQEGAGRHHVERVLGEIIAAFATGGTENGRDAVDTGTG